MNKICVYAICKNESKFVERWYKSASEADAVVVLDTGSTDDTVEKLKKLGATVEQKIIDPWRFDVARNESMKLIPNDCNILVCVDLDEVIEEGWANVLRERWIEGVHKCCWYKYVWSHLDNGSDGRIFWTNKIHCRGYKWYFPIHETLDFDPNYIEKLSKMEDLVVDEDGFKIHHYQEFKATRSSYLPLMEIRAKENPNNFPSQQYLTHQYLYECHYDKCIEKGNEIIKNFSKQLIPIEIANIYYFIGWSYYSLGKDKEALEYLYKGIEIDEKYIENYLKIAEILLFSKTDFENRYEKAYKVLTKGLMCAERYYSWLEGDDSFSTRIYDLLSIASFYYGKKKESLLFAFMARESNPENKRFQDNLNIIKEQTTNKDLAE